MTPTDRCPVCHRPVEAGALVCTDCGTDLATGTPLPGRPASPEHQARRDLGRTNHGLILLAVLGGIGCVLYFIVGHLAAGLSNVPRPWMAAEPILVLAGIPFGIAFAVALLRGKGPAMAIFHGLVVIGLGCLTLFLFLFATCLAMVAR